MTCFSPPFPFALKVSPGEAAAAGNTSLRKKKVSGKGSQSGEYDPQSVRRSTPAPETAGKKAEFFLFLASKQQAAAKASSRAKGHHKRRVQDATAAHQEEREAKSPANSSKKKASASRRQRLPMATANEGTKRELNSIRKSKGQRKNSQQQDKGHSNSRQAASAPRAIKMSAP